MNRVSVTITTTVDGNEYRQIVRTAVKQCFPDLVLPPLVNPVERIFYLPNAEVTWRA